MAADRSRRATTARRSRTLPPADRHVRRTPRRSRARRFGNFGNVTRSIGKWKNGALQPITSGMQGAVHQVADILGDWREEVVTFTNGELRIYSTTIPATDRRVCLMQDPIYRHGVTFRTMGYPHVPQVSYYLGEK